MSDNVWVQTNDIVSIEDDSSFEIKGRFDRVINSAGRKIHPEELEKLLVRVITNPHRFYRRDSGCDLWPTGNFILYRRLGYVKSTSCSGFIAFAF